MAGVMSTRVQLRRASDLDRAGAFAYRWRTTTMRARTRRAWTEGVLLADPDEGVTRLGPDVEGFTTAAAVLADVRHLTGQLPVMVDLRVDQPPAETRDDLHRPWGRRPRYDRPGLRGETLGERAARMRQQNDDG